MLAEPPLPPGDRRLRLHDDQGLLPPAPVQGYPRPKKLVGWCESRTSAASLEHGELMPKGEDLRLQRGAGSKERGQEGEESVQGGHREARPVGRAKAGSLARRRVPVRWAVQLVQTQGVRVLGRHTRWRAPPGARIPALPGRIPPSGERSGPSVSHTNPPAPEIFRRPRRRPASFGPLLTAQSPMK